MINITNATDLAMVKKPVTEKKKVKRNKATFEASDENMKLLLNAEAYWDSLRTFREKRNRTRNYRMGLQWEDIVTDPDTNDLITEDELIKRNGKVPLKQNIIGQLANSYLGQYRSNPSKPMVIATSRNRQAESEMMSAELESILLSNKSDDLDAALVNEFITSGLTAQKISWGFVKEKDRKEIIIKNTNSNNLFWNTDISDIRGIDLTMIGERIECSLEDIITSFAKNKTDEEDIREIYAHSNTEDLWAVLPQDKSRFDNTSFLYASDDNKVMLFEIWYLEGGWFKSVHDWADGKQTITDKSKEELEAENQNRIKIGLEYGLMEEEIPLLEWEDVYEQVWKVKWLSPWGHCFMEMDTPYLHQEHPYAFNAYPLIDGEIWGFLSEFIDQQRYINRLITLWDFIISASSKGVLMIEESMIPEGHTPESFAAEYRKFNGVIIYKQKPGMTNIPQQISANSTNIGIQEMLALQLKLINDISGIQGAMQGQQPQSGTPASMYALQMQNSSINVLDKMKSFDAGIQKRNFKVLKMIKQFRNEPRYNSTVGTAYSEDAKYFDPESIKDLDFDTIITKGKDAPAYRMMMDDLLMQLLQAQQIDIKMYLENSSAPFADKLLADIQKREEQMMQGQLPGNVPPELMQQVQQGANPQAMQMLNGALK